MGLQPPAFVAPLSPHPLRASRWDATPRFGAAAHAALEHRATSTMLSASSASSTAPSLTPAQLASSLSTILLTAALLRLMGLQSQSTRILSAAARMAGQLSIMGIFVLTPLFAFADSSPWKIAGWIAIVAVLASKEAKSRSRYTYTGQMRDCLLAIGGGVGLTLVHLATCILHPPFSSSRVTVNAPTLIPIAGMLFGNALSATTLGMSRLLSNFLDAGRARVELRLSRGANVWEASLPAVREAVEAALMPTVNAMASTGLIFMPGMMTGQILGGQSPSSAAAYQIMIYFAIAASSCLTAMFLSGIVTARMFDLHSQALKPRRFIPGLDESKEEIENTLEVSTEQTVDTGSQSKFALLGRESSSGASTEPLLRIRQLTVESTNLTVPSLDIYLRDRIGIRGRSGIGKTQLLRSLARLDPLGAGTDTAVENANDIVLEGQLWTDISPAQWRSRVMWVSQDRPTLSGTPRHFFEQILKYRAHRHSKEHNNEDTTTTKTPMDMAGTWNLDDEAWDKPWSEISGGEAQRISLAIALHLQPKVLLLDEPTSSCDADATLRIEHTLMKSNATLVVVSHSEEQLSRLCSSTIELS